MSLLAGIRVVEISTIYSVLKNLGSLISKGNSRQQVRGFYAFLE